MMRSISFLSSALFLSAVLAAAQGPGRQGMMMPRYDPATEAHFKGTVEAVKPVHHGGGMTGTHLMVKIGDESKEVMLGPADFVSGKGFAFAAGDTIELTGSKATMGGTEYIVAREVVKDGKTLTLRNKDGVPEWAGMRMGRGRADK